MPSPIPLRQVCVALLLLAGAVGLRSAEARGGAVESDLYVVHPDASGVRLLQARGFDLPEARRGASPMPQRLVLTPDQRDDLAANGVRVELWRDADGQSASDLARLQAEAGFKVWRSFDEPGGIKDEINQLAADHPDIVQLVRVGTSVQDRPILALRVTKDAATTPEGSRPAVLFSSMQHAREWISVEVNRRLLRHMVDDYATDATVRQWVDTRELWFVLVANPDGYQYTFTEGHRLWRKNMRDNNGDGQITQLDGVDPNRNFDNHWRYDNEGSSSNRDSDTFRGTAPASEPETQAMQGLLNRGGERWHFVFQVNYHSAAELLLYGLGWQVKTPSADTPIQAALSGTRGHSAIPGFLPELSADLYITNGETCDYAASVVNTLCWTPELSDGGSGGGFVFPDDEALVQQEYLNNLPFAQDVISSAARPGEPTSHLGNAVAPLIATTFSVSYGDPQVVSVNADRSLGEVTLKYRIGNGPVQTGTTKEWAGGERFGDVGDVIRHELRGMVRGARSGDDVAVWFEAGVAVTAPFTYHQTSTGAAPVLIVAAEDYSGIVPALAPTTGPKYLDVYRQSLATAGLTADVYDIDAQGRHAPSALGALSHYRAVVWYTGDDIITRDVGMPNGTLSRVAQDTMIAMRDYLNEGGKVVYAGKYAGRQYLTDFEFDPAGNGPCGSGPSNCEPISDDFVSYYLAAGAVLPSDDGAIEPEANRAGSGRGWWSTSGDNLDTSVARSFDLAGAAAPVEFAFDSTWSIEADYDYGHLEVSTDGGTTWTAIGDKDGAFTNSNPNGNNLDWGLTGAGTARLRFDLSAFAGRQLALRLRYRSDGGLAEAGWFVDNLALTVANGVRYQDDLEGGFGEWTSAGWTVTPLEPSGAPVPYGMTGRAGALQGLSWNFGPPTAPTQNHNELFVPLSASLPVGRYPQFASHNLAWTDRPGEGPHDGAHEVYSGAVSFGYQRLQRTIDLTSAGTGSLSFWASYNVTGGYAAVFVEAHTPGSDDWTTLPDVDGHLTPENALTCGYDFWYNRHPQLQHYMALDTSGADPTCRPAGSTGQWYAATGNSDGWQHLTIDLSAYAGQKVEVAIAYLSWSANLGLAIDDVAISTGERTSFEDGLGGWSVGGAPPGSQANQQEPAVASAEDYPVGGIVMTADTAYLGFGLEGIADVATRTELVRRLMESLGVVRSQQSIYLPMLGNGGP